MGMGYDPNKMQFWGSDRRDEALSSAEEWAQRNYVLAGNPDRIKNENMLYQQFIDQKILPELDVKRDLAYVNKRKENFRDATERSEIFEGILLQLSKKYDFFKYENSKDAVGIVQATKYDDIANKLDLLVEIKQQDGKIIRIALDATVGDQNDYAKKSKTIKDELSKGHGARAKYVKSKVEEGKLMSLAGLPRAIIGYPRENLEYLCKEMQENEQVGLGEKRRPREFDEFSASMIKELISQLKWQEQELEAKGKNESKVYKNIKAAINHFESISQNRNIKKNTGNEIFQVARIDFDNLY